MMDIIKKIMILEELSNIKIVEYIDFEKSGGRLSDVTEFYNKEFKKSQHSDSFKRSKYEKSDSVILVALLNDKIVGLLESWVNDDKRILSTIVVDSKYRGQGLFKDMFNDFVKKIKEDKIYLHFRDSNRHYLETVYKSIGFSELKEVGEYVNGETKWEMLYDKKFR